MTNRSIAEELHLSHHTVDAHLKHVYLKLDIHSRVKLTVLALQQHVPVN
jgi:DNA-binding NarL/FixJ family response regulator